MRRSGGRAEGHGNRKMDLARSNRGRQRRSIVVVGASAFRGHHRLLATEAAHAPPAAVVSHGGPCVRARVARCREVARMRALCRAAHVARRSAASGCPIIVTSIASVSARPLWKHNSSGRKLVQAHERDWLGDGQSVVGSKLASTSQTQDHGRPPSALMQHKVTASGIATACVWGVVTWTSQTTGLATRLFNLSQGHWVC